MVSYNEEDDAKTSGGYISTVANYTWVCKDWRDCPDFVWTALASVKTISKLALVNDWPGLSFNFKLPSGKTYASKYKPSFIISAELWSRRSFDSWRSSLFFPISNLLALIDNLTFTKSLGLPLITVSWLNFTTKTGWKFSVVWTTEYVNGFAQLSIYGVHGLHSAFKP